MSSLYYLIPIALVLGLIGLAAFVWSLRTGQYDDLDGDAQRALQDDAPLSAAEAAQRRRAQKAAK